MKMNGKFLLRRSSLLLVGCFFLFLTSAYAADYQKEIKHALKETGLYSHDMYYLLLGTAATESDFGKITKQVNGPALGIFQIEPATHQDIWKNYLAYKPKLTERVLRTKWKWIPWQTQLRYNVKYQTVMAAVHYQRALERLNYRLPSHKKPWSLAWFYKLTFNSYKGKGTTIRFYQKYKEYVI